MGYHINNIGLDWSDLNGGSSGCCGSVAIGTGNTSVVAVQGLLPHTTSRWCFVVVANIDYEVVRMSYIERVRVLTAKTGRLDIPVAPKEESTEYRLSHDVQNTVEDGFRIRRNNITALRKSPGDRVEKPEEDSPDTANQVYFRDIWANGSSVLARGPGDSPGDPEEGNATEGEVTPLIAISDICV